MGIPLVSGREFVRADDEIAHPVAVVNETMSARFWAGRDPVGKRLQVNGRWVQVVILSEFESPEPGQTAGPVFLRAHAPECVRTGAGSPHKART